MIPLPKDVTDWLTGVFSNTNNSASSKLTLVPNSHEPWMDFAVIESLQRVSVPFTFKSDWTVNIDTHWLGSAPLWRTWEIADIGFLVIFRTAKQLIRSKVALLQSKRLYAERYKPETDQEKEMYYTQGFGRMLTDDQKFEEMIKPKLFRFTKDSEYVALKKGSEQWVAVERYEKETQIPVYYLLYNPLAVPSDVPVPHPNGYKADGKNEAGCRVIPCRHVRKLMEKAKTKDSPSYGDLVSSLVEPFTEKANRGGWRLEHFVVDLLLNCKTGRVTDIRNDEGLYQVFNRRSGPIQAAISITIDAPAGFDWAVQPD
jgi:hypothetical protein